MRRIYTVKLNGEKCLHCGQHIFGEGAIIQSKSFRLHGKSFPSQKRYIHAHCYDELCKKDKDK